MKFSRHVLAAVSILTIGTSPAICSTAVFSSLAPNPSNPSQPLAASAIFSLTGNQLTIELKNTAGINSQKYVDTDVLTGVFFGTDPQNLTPVRATAPHTVDTAGNPLCIVDCD